MELAPGLGDRLVDLVQSAGFVPYAFVLAFVAGAAHAVGPGHGKSLAAAYLVGSGGRLRDAAWLGASVAVMHTVSVLVIGVAWTFFSLSDLVYATDRRPRASRSPHHRRYADSSGAAVSIRFSG